jgi:hypothetical protein
MATENPTGGERAVPLSIPPEQVQYLRRELTGFKSGLEEDAQTHADRPDAQRWLATAEAYGRLIAGLDAGEVVPDDHVRRLVREWAEAYDGSEHYARVVFEHNAIAALRDQIGAGQ